MDGQQHFTHSSNKGPDLAYAIPGSWLLSQTPLSLQHHTKRFTATRELTHYQKHWHCLRNLGPWLAPKNRKINTLSSVFFWRFASAQAWPTSITSHWYKSKNNREIFTSSPRRYLCRNSGPSTCCMSFANVWTWNRLNDLAPRYMHENKVDIDIGIIGLKQFDAQSRICLQFQSSNLKELASKLMLPPL